MFHHQTSDCLKYLFDITNFFAIATIYALHAKIFILWIRFSINFKCHKFYELWMLSMSSHVYFNLFSKNLVGNQSSTNSSSKSNFVRKKSSEVKSTWLRLLIVGWSSVISTVMSSPMTTSLRSRDYEWDTQSQKNLDFKMSSYYTTRRLRKLTNVIPKQQRSS